MKQEIRVLGNDMRSKQVWVNEPGNETSPVHF